MFVCDKNFSCCDYQYWDTVEDIEQDAKECGHLIEVEPVRHGQWKFDINPYTHTWNYKCSGKDGCGCFVTDDTDYCPNCGAKMDLED